MVALLLTKSLSDTIKAMGDFKEILGTILLPVALAIASIGASLAVGSSLFEPLRKWLRGSPSREREPNRVGITVPGSVSHQKFRGVDQNNRSE